MVKNPPSNVRDIRDAGLIPELGRSPGGGHGNPQQYCLENPMDRGALWATDHGVAKTRTQLKDLTYMRINIEQSYGLCGRGRGWEDLGEWH